MTVDLDDMSRDELMQLRRDVDKAISTLEDRRRSEARAAAEKAVREHGFSLDEIVGQRGKTTGGTKNPPKYRNPQDPRQTWSGRGRQPGWIKDALAEGRSLEEFAI